MNSRPEHEDVRFRAETSVGGGVLYVNRDELQALSPKTLVSTGENLIGAPRGKPAPVTSHSIVEPRAKRRTSGKTSRVCSARSALR